MSLFWMQFFSKKLTRISLIIQLFFICLFINNNKLNTWPVATVTSKNLRRAVWEVTSIPKNVAGL